MRTLGVYVWKEWREFRAVAIGLLVALPLLFAIAAFALPARAFADRDAGGLVATIGGLGAMLIALFAITTDLFAGEVRRGRMAFLGRLPAGLGRPFFAKALVFLVGVTGFFVYGFQLGAWTAALRGGGAPGLLEIAGRTLPDGTWRVGHEFFWLSMVVLLALPVSCFAPRGVLTIPLTALVGAILTALVPLMQRNVVEFAYAADARLLLIALPPLAAYLAFVRGYRAGGGWPRALKWTMAVLLLACLYPSIPRARAFFAERGWLPTREALLEAYLGADANYLYVSRVGFYEDGMTGVWLAPLRIDLASGEVREMQPAPLGTLGDLRRTRQPVAQPYLRYDNGILDTRTGALADVPLREATLAVARATSHLLSADGKPMWLRGSRVEWDGGGVDLGGTLRHSSPDGVTLSLVHVYSVFDPYRLEVGDLRGRGLAGWQVVMRRGEWLVHRERRRRNEPRWMLYDPDAETCRDVAVPLGSFPTVLDDGRLLVHRTTGEIDLVDPASGVSAPVLFEDGSRARAERFRNASYSGLQGTAVRDARGRRLFWLGTRLARLQGGRLVRTADPQAGFLNLIGCGGGDTCYARVSEHSIVELAFGSEVVRTLYRVRNGDRLETR